MDTLNRDRNNASESSPASEASGTTLNAPFRFIISSKTYSFVDVYFLIQRYLSQGPLQRTLEVSSIIHL